MTADELTAGYEQRERSVHGGSDRLADHRDRLARLYDAIGVDPEVYDCAGDR
ncbi:hypothetical protein FOB84_17135 [Gordonia bronchialis]|uniref:hypothetical protein n=1 Tax=Gordonia bronchialis TaxID=2054 RepID=UPI0003217B6B|nr:hypothetical protein [Gordonia bronchialis]MCC3323405.1 hypothetical protein [Gordonia bronchialis]QGS25607.1 hypothetical protein FOB84_17135 [Gordonia bronchialis]UAK37987.1 hypothetical protein K8O93_23650 [Gordonia bronchialis]